MHQPSQSQTTEDALSFIGRFGTARTDLGIDRSRPKVLEVSQVWEDLLLDTRHFARGRAVTIGWGAARTDFGAEVPGGQHTLLQPSADGYEAVVLAEWEAFADIGDSRLSMDELVAEGRAVRVDDGYRISLTDDTRLVLEVDGVVFAARWVPAGRRVIGAFLFDFAFLGVLGFFSFLGVMFGLMVFFMPGNPSIGVAQLDGHFAHMTLEAREREPVARVQPQPSSEGAAAPRAAAPEPEAPTERGRKLQQQRLDRQVAENSGVLRYLNEMGGAAGFGSGPDAMLVAGIGVIGSHGGPIGDAGFRGKGDGWGAIGGVESIGAVGNGRVGSGYGAGGGALDAKVDGAISQLGGEPIILGALDRSLVDDVIKRNMNQIRYCYQRQLNRSPHLAGKITIKFVIARDGSVSAASVKSSSMKNDAVENCLASRFLRLQFPRPKGGGIVMVSYPFMFSPG
jgi:outer membrane biosynthesis protein TonB